MELLQGLPFNPPQKNLPGLGEQDIEAASY